MQAMLVSIHAPGRGATTVSVVVKMYKQGFNSRTREGCDCGGRQPLKRRVYRFNSRTREGCDLIVATPNLSHCLFQFTHPGGVRR